MVGPAWEYLFGERRQILLPLVLRRAGLLLAGVLASLFTARRHSHSSARGDGDCRAGKTRPWEGEVEGEGRPISREGGLISLQHFDGVLKL